MVEKSNYCECKDENYTFNFETKQCTGKIIIKIIMRIKNNNKQKTINRSKTC